VSVVNRRYFNDEGREQWNEHSRRGYLASFLDFENLLNLTLKGCMVKTRRDDEILGKSRR
jgi:hypothetical protein